MTNFRIADTFTDSLARLTGEERKAVKTTAFDLQIDPANPGMQFHKLDKARDRNFWSVRVNADVRLIVHRTAGSLLLCYVDHHDKAYAWAERRKLEPHPTTGAAQLVELRETVREITIPRYVEAAAAAPPPRQMPLLFKDIEQEALLEYGVPAEWVGDVLAATEDTLFELSDHLPQEAAEALLELATGGKPRAPQRAPEATDPFAHPDAQRRFRVVGNVEELERALDYPWDKWSVFLHPAQRELVKRHYAGPARIAGSAGTGKTVVALHRAAHLARTNPKARVLVTTFSLTLARMLTQKVRRLVGDDADLTGRIVVRAVDEVGIELYQRSFGNPKVPTPGMMRTLLAAISKDVGSHSFSDRFLLQEWTDVVDAWRLTSWEAYRDVARLGRKTRLGEKQRMILWQIFEMAQGILHERGLFTMPMVFASVVEELRKGAPPPFKFAVVDEAQDVNAPQLQFLAALAGNRPNALFFAGDLGQRIFQTPFSWKSLGVDVRGRSYTLRINYRTSHQIRRQADRLLGKEIADVDGVVEARGGTISVFNGVEPEVKVLESEEREQDAIGAWIRELTTKGVLPEEIAVFVRSEAEIPRAKRAVTIAELGATTPEAGVDPEPGKVPVMPMHLAKGLEFRAVVVAACDDEIVPLQSRIEAVVDESDLEEVYNTERHLLYVACTRARDHLLVTGVRPASEFLEDLRPELRLE
jgi:superfamily I DNA/RNA helicase/mRNA-degrading endonuclease RelE of RelBE toxin-antitoxin system